jgi:hypothetical protein
MHAVCTFPHPFLHNKMVAPLVLHGGTKSTHKWKGLDRDLHYVMSTVWSCWLCLMFYPFDYKYSPLLHKHFLLYSTSSSNSPQVLSDLFTMNYAASPLWDTRYYSYPLKLPPFYRPLKYGSCCLSTIESFSPYCYLCSQSFPLSFSSFRC